jgi:hypothetical protein
MLSNRPAPAGPSVPPDVRGGAAGPRIWPAMAAFVAAAAVLFLVVAVVSPRLAVPPHPPLAPPFSGPSWLRGWAQWDSGWYYRIAHDGYSFAGRHQSTVAYFPVYPLAVRAAALVVGDVYVAGILVTFVAGAAVAALLLAWLRERMAPAAAWTALAAFLLFPYAFDVYGVVYADAVFVVTVLGAFLLLEADRPVLAGLVGALATAARPVGIVLVAALVVRALERRGALRPPSGGLVDWHRLRPADAGVLLSVLGLGLWCLFLWHRFGDPFAFATAEAGWQQSPGPKTWLKVQFFHDMAHVWNLGWWGVFYVAHPVLTVAAACLVPRVFRRFGAGYGVYVALLVGLSALSTQNFFGMARYLLAAFPIFAVVGELLAQRPALRRVALPASGLGLVLVTAVFGTGHYVS